MDATHCPPEFQPEPLVWLTRADVISESGLSKGTVDDRARRGIVPGTKGRGASRYARRFPVLRTPEYEKWLAGVIHRSRRLAARKEAQALAKSKGRRITHGAAIARYADRICCTMIRMKNGSFERQTNAENMRIFSILYEVVQEWRELGRLLQDRGISEQWLKDRM